MNAKDEENTVKRELRDNKNMSADVEETFIYSTGSLEA